MYPRPWRYARISLYIGLETACVGPPERADERVSTEEKVSHMGASVPCNTSPTDGGDIRAADVQMKLTDWLRLNRLHILLRLRRTTSGRETLENVWRMERLYIPSNCFPKGRRRRRGRERGKEGGPLSLLHRSHGSSLSRTFLRFKRRSEITNGGFSPREKLF